MSLLSWMAGAWRAGAWRIGAWLRLAAPAASVHEQIQARVQSVLLSAATAAGPRVVRDNVDAPAAAEMPALNVLRGRGSFEPFTDQADVHVAEFKVSHWAAGSSWKEATDSLHHQVHAALLADAVLASLARSLRCVATERQAAGGDVPVGRLTATYRAQTALHPRDLSRVLA